MERSPELGVWEGAGLGPWGQTLQIICIKCSVCLDTVFLQGGAAGLWSELLPGRVGSPSSAGHVTFRAWILHATPIPCNPIASDSPPPHPPPPLSSGL